MKISIRTNIINKKVPRVNIHRYKDRKRPEEVWKYGRMDENITNIIIHVMKGVWGLSTDSFLA